MFSINTFLITRNIFCTILYLLLPSFNVLFYLLSLSILQRFLFFVWSFCVIDFFLYHVSSAIFCFFSLFNHTFSCLISNGPFSLSASFIFKVINFSKISFCRIFLLHAWPLLVSLLNKMDMHVGSISLLLFFFAHAHLYQLTWQIITLCTSIIVRRLAIQSKVTF